MWLSKVSRHHWTSVSLGSLPVSSPAVNLGPSMPASRDRLASSALTGKHAQVSLSLAKLKLLPVRVVPAGRPRLWARYVKVSEADGRRGTRGGRVTVRPRQKRVH